MPFHFDFSAIQILWTLTFASLLVLLIVLLGRDRARRYPFFTFSIALVALRLLVSRLLSGRTAPIVLNAILISLTILISIVGVLVAIEMARRAFAGASRRAWLTGTVLVLAVAGIVLWLWGPWPSWQTLTAGGSVAVLRFMQLIAQRGDMLAGLLAIEIGILIALFGRRFHAGWRSHTQQLVIGLSAAAFAQLAVQAIWQAIVVKVTIHSQAEYTRVIGIQSKLYNASSVVYICALLWWIVCMWNDEPGAVAAAVAEQADPVHAIPARDHEISE